MKRRLVQLRKIYRTPWKLTFLLSTLSTLILINRIDISIIISVLFMSLILTLCAVYDYKNMIIPDIVTIPSIILVWTYNFIFRSDSLYSYVFPAILGALVLLTVGYLLNYSLGIDSIGGGDIKLIFFICSFLGTSQSVVMFLLLSVLHFVFSILYTLLQKDKVVNTIPLAPSLMVSSLLSIIIFENIVSKIHM